MLLDPAGSGPIGSGGVGSNPILAKPMSGTIWLYPTRELRRKNKLGVVSHGQLHDSAFTQEACYPRSQIRDPDQDQDQDIKGQVSDLRPLELLPGLRNFLFFLLLLQITKNLKIITGPLRR